MRCAVALGIGIGMLVGVGTAWSADVDASFTYQGRLEHNGVPVDGNADFQFTLWNAEAGGTQQGAMVPVTAVDVEHGQFTVELDFGFDVFAGDARWLQITVRSPAGSGSYYTLTPRQPVRAVPYALWARNAWNLTGNTGTSTGTNFLGTTDNVPLDVRSWGLRVYRFTAGYGGYSPNIVGGYSGNTASTDVYGATISGGGEAGLLNTVTDDFGTIGGGRLNQAGNNSSPTYDRQFATVGGGTGNTASGRTSTIGGGASNTADGENATIAGGLDNSASALWATVGGGYGHTASAQGATVGGGEGNDAMAEDAVVAGGSFNNASGNHSAICGGTSNAITAEYSFIGGGILNTVAGTQAATIAGGWYNNVQTDYSTIGGGQENTVTGVRGTVGGGRDNTAASSCATVCGGWGNAAAHYNSVVAGGRDNVASGDTSCIGGGYLNGTSGRWSMVPGGTQNDADGECSFAAGARAHAAHDGAFVWNDNCGASLASSTANEFRVRASGGVYIFSGAGTAAGVRLPAGSGSWSSLCDREAKMQLLPIDPGDVLQRVVALPLTTWSYRAEGEHVRHLGPMAQDFHAAFGLGPDNRHISDIDLDGVALAAIQGLHRQATQREAQLAELRAENRALAARLAAVEAMLGELCTEREEGGR